ncbi:hypothetical protein CAOG_07810 [Capsaspora owczarzaki ATCC 30864]|uniref:non-specific serine/threonine protein kinase n=1 Tax=Capsaspora owczarzaki (strain ATCC 30864) TaxID=595528 RepID=A0A0D2URW4_CAPO3|nr:hypothetical protein CAOG_07810 [Capsaspora owczarzaki ATCC 30864]KJE97706.1 TKL/IRAK protein kinase [Capsaspora owczarzaki ATCC 30864]|eukprot:XP_004342883.1 hypothetical protein CAOG_07810 [Capsaspora owczarzaki ATCC 30864]
MSNATVTLAQPTTAAEVEQVRAALLSPTCSIKTLLITDTAISPDVIARLLESLASNRSLTRLDISCNAIDNKTVAALASMLVHNRVLAYVDIHTPRTSKHRRAASASDILSTSASGSDTTINDTCSPAIAQALALNKSLVSLVLPLARFTDAGFTVILNSIATHNTTLLNLVLGGSQSLYIQNVLEGLLVRNRNMIAGTLASGPHPLQVTPPLSRTDSAEGSLVCSPKGTARSLDAVLSTNREDDEEPAGMFRKRRAASASAAHRHRNSTTVMSKQQSTPLFDTTNWSSAAAPSAVSPEPSAPCESETSSTGSATLPSRPADSGHVTAWLNSLGASSSSTALLSGATESMGGGHSQSILPSLVSPSIASSLASNINALQALLPRLLTEASQKQDEVTERLQLRSLLSTANSTIDDLRRELAETHQRLLAETDRHALERASAQAQIAALTTELNNMKLAAQQMELARHAASVAAHVPSTAAMSSTGTPNGHQQSSPLTAPASKASSQQGSKVGRHRPINLSFATHDNSTRVRRAESSMVTFAAHQIAEATGSFAASNIIGKGRWGTVFKAKLLGTDVAVKRVTQASIAQFEAELVALSYFRHPNIVQIIGLAKDDDYLFIVLERLCNGSLSERLMCASGTDPLTVSTRVNIALGVAQGMEYLQSAIPRLPMFHLDLKSANILLDGAFAPKIADFGLTRAVPLALDGPDSFSQVPKLQGTLAYICPEYLTYGRVSRRTDVFSYGVILLELLTGRVADANLRVDARRQWKLHRSLEAMLDPKLGQLSANQSSVALATARVAMDCVDESRLDRPPFKSLVHFFSQVVESGHANGADLISATTCPTQSLEELRRRECVVCCDAPTNAQLRPCRHAATCEACAQELLDRHEACPVCRCLVQSYIIGDFQHTFTAATTPNAESSLPFHYKEQTRSDTRV